MTKFFLLAFILFQSVALAQTVNSTSYEASLPLVDGERNLGEVKVKIVGENIEWVDRNDLMTLLGNMVKADTLKSLEKLPPEINPASLPFPFRFDATNLQIITSLPLEMKSSQSVDLTDDLPNSRNALRPATLGGAINYRLEKNWGSETLGGDNFNAQFNSFLNANSLVLENQTFYQDNTQTKWFRGDTRLVKDFEKSQIRAQAGDVYPNIQGFMVGRPMGGVNIHRNFSLNPYRLPYPTGTQSFTLKSRSLVKYHVNNVLVKTEYLNPGNYTAKDIPLNNGLNIILVEATDELGYKQTFIFRSAASINLLYKGESRFDVSYGVPFIDNAVKREYRQNDGKVFSGFYQYGLSTTQSGSVYLQNQDDFSLMGSEFIQATILGNFNFGHARSQDNVNQGFASSVGYQFVSQGDKWFQSQSLGLRYENRSTDFRTTGTDSQASIQNFYAANYTLPLARVMTLSLGGNYGDVRNNDLENRIGYDATANFRLFEHHNLSFFVGRARDEFKKYNDTAYVFLTITFPQSSDFVSAFHDIQRKNTRVTHLHDNQNRLYSPRTTTTLENSPTAQQGEADLYVPTPMGDFGGRVTANHLIENDQQNLRGTLRLNSALAFAYDEGEFGFGISRPVPGSFVLFKPGESLKGQKIALKSTSPFTEAATGLFDEIIFTNLLAYQYRDVQLDPTFLDEGRSLSQERFALYPTYRSAHLIKLEDKGVLMVRGRLLDQAGKPLGLVVGRLGESTFFTNRNGEFFIEGIEPGSYEMRIEDTPGSFNITTDKKAHGILDLGTITLKDEP